MGSRDQSPLASSTSTPQDTMAVWADNIKFVKDIIDTKFGKIDQAVQEIEEGLSVLETEVKSSQAKEKYTFALRSLKLMQPQEIEILVETILCVSTQLFSTVTSNYGIFKDLHENERKSLETLATEKLAKRREVLQKSEELKKKYHISE